MGGIAIGSNGPPQSCAQPYFRLIFCEGVVIYISWFSSDTQWPQIKWPLSCFKQDKN